MAKRQRIDTVTGAVAIMQAGLKPLAAPAHVPLADDDGPFWKSVIAEKAVSEWTAHDLEIAALLARAMRRLEAEESRVDAEQSVLCSANGAPMQNPRLRVVADLHARVIKYRQTLGIHSRAKAGEARDVGKRRSIAKGIEGNNPLDDELLARPSIQ